MALAGEELQEGRLGQGCRGLQPPAVRARLRGAREVPGGLEVQKEGGIWREAGLLESGQVLGQGPGFLPPYSPAPLSGGTPRRVGKQARVAGDAPAGARGAAPERGSATASLSGGRRGGSRTGVTGRASALVGSGG